MLFRSRQWVLQTFSLYDGEMEFIERLLLDDIRNNSAWNQRFFVLSRSGGWGRETVEREVVFALQKIELVKRRRAPGIISGAC